MPARSKRRKAVVIEIDMSAIPMENPYEQNMEIYNINYGLGALVVP